MGKKKTKNSIMGLVLAVVVIIGAVMATAGVFMDWVKYSVDSVIGSGKTDAFLLKDIANSKIEFEMAGAMNSFAYITMILSIVTAALVILSKFLHIGILRPLATLSGALTVISTILLIVFVCMFCSKNGNVNISGLGKANYVWAVGSILTVIGGFVSGLCGLATFKK